MKYELIHLVLDELCVSCGSHSYIYAPYNVNVMKYSSVN